MITCNSIWLPPPDIEMQFSLEFSLAQIFIATYADQELASEARNAYHGGLCPDLETGRKVVGGIEYCAVFAFIVVQLFNVVV